MPLSLVGQQVGNYKIVKPLGEGGMGVVYLGEHPLIGKKVAIKVLHEQMTRAEDVVARFFTEAKAVNDIAHQNIVDIVDFGRITVEGRELVYLTMEFLEGETLRDRLKRTGVTPGEAIRITIQCAAALAASHRKGVVHRDLKPDNIFLLQRGGEDLFVKLLDFGIAKVMDDPTSGEGGHKTRAGSVLGTPAYMSPEQCDGRGNIDHRADIYALGMVLYEMLCGRVAFVGEGFGEILVAQMTQPPPPPSTFRPNFRPELEAVVLRCLAKDRQARYQTMDELRAALESLIGMVTGASQAPAMPMAGAGGTSPSSPAAALGGGTLGTAGMAPAPSTTLSAAAGEAAAPAGGARRSPLWLGLTAVLLLGGGAGAYLLFGSPSTPTDTAAAVTPASAPVADDIVHVLIDSTPQGAQVTRAGVGAIGTTPLDLTLKKGDLAFEVVLTLEGYKSTMRSVSADRDRDILVALEKEASPSMVPEPLDHTMGRDRAHREAPRPPSNLGGKQRSPRQQNVDPDGVLAPSL
ncbi:MAG TPA: protein kinase [Polyangia bacterium]|jgi:serine/threonine-protein kinase|nr:protein kinase [Polyangia bacterium]